jgi:predicted membrane protein
MNAEHEMHAPHPSPEVRLEGHFRHHRHHHHGRGIIPGLVVIAWGALLLLRELGTIDPELRALDFWPLLLVGFGLSGALHGRRLGSRLLGLVVALFGGALLAERLGHVSTGAAQLWPLLIVAAGIAIVWNGMTHRRHHQGIAHQAVSSDELRRSVTMGSLALVVDSREFKGGSIGATMGEVKIDLRRADFPGDAVTLELSLLMSGVELCLPTHWRVLNDVSTTMGVVEDKTDPRPDGAGVQKTLVLRGTITMGAVTIKS